MNGVFGTARVIAGKNTVVPHGTGAFPPPNYYIRLIRAINTVQQPPVTQDVHAMQTSDS